MMERDNGSLTVRPPIVNVIMDARVKPAHDARGWAPAGILLASRGKRPGAGMTLERIFYGYMALVGIASGALLAAVPRAQDFVIKPYFWVLLAVGLFDGAVYLIGRNAGGAMLTMNARLIGFVIGIVLMVAVAMLAGAPVRYF